MRKILLYQVIAICIIICIQVMPLAHVSAGQLAIESGKVVRLSNGITRIDITGKQSEGMAILANRENFNAHGFDVLSLYIKTIDRESKKPIWSIVPVFDGDRERLQLTIGGGADCFTHDFRLLRDSNKQPLRLIVAERPLGEGYAVADVVTFSAYILRVNKEGETGHPLYYFELIKTFKSRQKYCDVGEAFKMELGLDDYTNKSR